MSTINLGALHAPYAGLLRGALALASPHGVRLALDIGCGPGLKSGWLAERLAPGGLQLGIDRDRVALAEAARRAQGVWLVGDAGDLPLPTASLDLCWCVAALDLFDSPQLALREARRVLRPAGTLVLATATQLWVRLRAWPDALYAAWAERALPAPGDGLGASLIERLIEAGFAPVDLRAYLLDPPQAGLARAGLPLAAWDVLATQVASALTPDERAACAQAEALAEPAPLAVLLVVAGRAGAIIDQTP